MLPSFRDVELRIERLLERDFVRLWHHHLHPNTVVRELARALEEGASYNADRGHPSAAPTIYYVHIKSLDAENLLRHVPDFPKLMSQQLILIARELNLTLLAPPVVNIVTTDNISANDIQITTEFSPLHEQRTHRLSNSIPITRPQIPSRLHAYIIVNGRHEVRLTQPLFTIGRSTKNTLILENPGVSRYHAQLRLVKQTWTTFDLNSQRGTFVNGERIDQTPLHAGDVISIATVQLIFATEKHHINTSEDTISLPAQTVPLPNPQQPTEYG